MCFLQVYPDLQNKYFLHDPGLDLNQIPQEKLCELQRKLPKGWPTYWKFTKKKLNLENFPLNYPERACNCNSQYFFDKISITFWIDFTREKQNLRTVSSFCTSVYAFKIEALFETSNKDGIESQRNDITLFIDCQIT